MKKLVGLGLVLIGCGGGNANSNASSSSNDIKSMPAYPAQTATTTAPAPPPAKPTDPKAICAGAQPVTAKSSFFDDDRSLGLSGSSAKAKDTPYTMADLNALDKKSSYEELLGHAEDIAPAQRNAAWEKLVEKAAVGYMSSLTTGTSANEGVWTSQSLVKRYPFLSKSNDFMTKRGEAAKVVSDRCLADSYRGQHCIDMMKQFIQVPNTSPDIGFQFGKIVRHHMNHYVAVPFFKWALDNRKDNDAAYCADEDFRMAVVAGLGLPTEYDGAADSRSMATDRCWPALKDDATKALVDSPTGYVRDNVCAVMKAKGEL